MLDEKSAREEKYRYACDWVLAQRASILAMRRIQAANYNPDDALRAEIDHCIQMVEAAAQRYREVDAKYPTIYVECPPILDQLFG